MSGAPPRVRFPPRRRLSRGGEARRRRVLRGDGPAALGRGPRCTRRRPPSSAGSRHPTRCSCSGGRLRLARGGADAVGRARDRRDRLLRHARRQPRRLLAIGAGEPRVGARARLRRGELVPVALQAQRPPPHVRERRRAGRRHRRRAVPPPRADRSGAAPSTATSTSTPGRSTACCALKWWFVDDVVDLVRGRIGRLPFPRPRAARARGVRRPGKAVFVAWALVVPVLVFRSGWAVALFLLGSLSLGRRARDGVPARPRVPRRSSTRPARRPADADRLGGAPGRAPPWTSRPRTGSSPGTSAGSTSRSSTTSSRTCATCTTRRSPRIVEATCRAHGIPLPHGAEPGAAIAAHYRFLRALGRRSLTRAVGAAGRGRRSGRPPRAAWRAARAGVRARYDARKVHPGHAVRERPHRPLRTVHRGCSPRPAVAGPHPPEPEPGEARHRPGLLVPVPPADLARRVQLAVLEGPPQMVAREEELVAGRGAAAPAVWPGTGMATRSAASAQRPSPWTSARRPVSLVTSSRWRIRSQPSASRRNRVIGDVVAVREEHPRRPQRAQPLKEGRGGRGESTSTFPSGRRISQERRAVGGARPPTRSGARRARPPPAARPPPRRRRTWEREPMAATGQDTSARSERAGATPGRPAGVRRRRARVAAAEGPGRELAAGVAGDAAVVDEEVARDVGRAGRAPGKATLVV